MSTDTALATREDRPAPIQMGARGVALQTFEDVFRFAKAVSMTPFAPKDFRTPEAIAVAIAYGLELGLTPMQALQGVAVVNGRPSLYGDALVAVVKASGLCEDMREWVDGANDARAAHCEVKRRGTPTPVVAVFSVADAKRAGLWGKGGPWTQYPDRMLQMRARGFALRDAFADVLRGVISTEEAEDIPAPTRPAPEPQADPAPDAIDAEEVRPTYTQMDAFNAAVDANADDEVPAPVAESPAPSANLAAFGRAAVDNLSAEEKRKLLNQTLRQADVRPLGFLERHGHTRETILEVTDKRLVELIDEAMVLLERKQHPVTPERAADLRSLVQATGNEAYLRKKLGVAFGRFEDLSEREAGVIVDLVEAARRT